MMVCETIICALKLSLGMSKRLLTHALVSQTMVKVSLWIEYFEIKSAHSKIFECAKRVHKEGFKKLSDFNDLTY